MPTDAYVPTFVPDDRFVANVRRDVARARRRARHRAVAALTLVALVAGSGAWYVDQRLSVQRVELGVVTGPDALDDGAPFNLLLVGTDSLAGNADSIVVVRVDPTARRLNVLSLYRDLVEDPSRPVKLSALDPDGIRGVLRRAYGIEVAHVVAASTVGFVEVASLAEVRLGLGAAVRDRSTGLDLGAGCAAVEPSQLLALVRSRHLQWRDSADAWRLDPTGDVGRVARQQIVLAALASALRSDDPSPVELLRLVDSALGSIAVDGGISGLDLVRLARLVSSSELGTVGSVPVALVGTSSAQNFLAAVRGPELDRVLHDFDGRPLTSSSAAPGSPVSGVPVGENPWTDLRPC